MILEELYDENDYEDIIDNFIMESAKAAWGKKGNQIVKRFRCSSGPRAGRVVSKPADCSKRLDVGRRQKMKHTHRRLGHRMSRKAQRTKRMNPISRQLKRRNKLLRDNDQNQVVNEYNVIGSAIHKDKIPQKYREMKLIGRGATSLVFEYDENHVLMLTRDEIKKDWLHRSDLGDLIEVIDSDHPERGIREKPVYVMKVKKLEPLSRDNKRKVKKIIEKLDQIRMKLGFESKRKNDWKQPYINKAIEVLDLEFNDQESVKEFFDFIMDYDPSQYGFDMGIRNFMQDKDGDIIAIDPVADSEIIDAFMRKRMR